MKELGEAIAYIWKMTPKDWRPNLILMLTAAALVYGYWTRLATPIEEAHAAGINNGEAIERLDKKGEARHQEDQQRFNRIENSQTQQGQKLNDVSRQLDVILRVMLTGQRPAPPVPSRR